MRDDGYDISHSVDVSNMMENEQKRRFRMSQDKIYYEDQTDWSPEDFYALWRYLNRLFQYVGPSSSLERALGDLENLSERDRKRAERVAAFQGKRTGRRDEELAALDLGRMSEDTRYLMKHMLIGMKRFDLALDRFPNLRALEEVGDLGHPIYLDANPRRSEDYLTSVGIYL